MFGSIAVNILTIPDVFTASLYTVAAPVAYVPAKLLFFLGKWRFLHCANNSLNLCIKAKPVLAVADATEYICILWLDCISAQKLVIKSDKTLHLLQP